MLQQGASEVRGKSSRGLERAVLDSESFRGKQKRLYSEEGEEWKGGVGHSKEI